MHEFIIENNILKKYTGDETYIEVPEGVTEIGPNVFAGVFLFTNKEIEEIKLPETLIKIDNDAFAYSHIKKIRIPDSTEIIYHTAFLGCYSLNEVIAPEKFYPVFKDTSWFKRNYTDKDGFTIYNHVLYKYSGNAETVIVPDTVQCIDSKAFELKDHLCIILPECIKERIRIEEPGDNTIFYTGIKVDLYDDYGPRIEENILTFLKLLKEHVEINKEVQVSYENYIKKHIHKIVSDIELDHLFFLLEHYQFSYKQYESIKEKVLSYENTELNALYLNKIHSFITDEDQKEYETQKERIQFGEYIQEDLEDIWEIVRIADEEAQWYEQYDPRHNYHNTYMITDYYNNLEEETIPSRINGKRITIVNFRERDVCLKCIHFNKGIYQVNFYTSKDSQLEEVYLSDSILCYTFSGNKNLRKVHLSDTCKNIPKGAFTSCTALEEINLPSTITNIDDEAFRGCTSLEYFNIPAGLKRIGAYAFFDCSKLRSITLPDTCKNISRGAFAYCTALEEINLPSTITNINDQAFRGCTSLEYFNIPAGLKKIEGFAFADCSKLRSIALPDTLKEINWSTFKNCTSLEKIRIPESLTVLPLSSFENCTSLCDVQLPDTLKEICNAAFFNCTSLTAIKIPELEYLGSNAFEGCTNLIDVTAPERFKECFKDTPWYKNKE